VRLITEMLTAPSAWASYLINGDDSGLEEGEKACADAWIATEGLGMPVSCDNAGFRHWFDASPHYGYSCDCQTYTFLVDSGD
jgi:hypothetical protein